METFQEVEPQPLKIIFSDLGSQDFGGYGSKADVEGGAPYGTNRTELKDPAKASTMTIPINPEEIQISNGADLATYKTPFFAELISISGLKLRSFTIESFFPYDTGHHYGRDDIEIYPQAVYIDWFQKVMQARKILLFSITGDIDYIVPFQCVISEFTYTLQPNKDILYSLTFKEYIDYRNYAKSRQFVLDGKNLVLESDSRDRSNLEGEITLGSVVRVVKGHVHINSVTLGVSDVAAVANIYKYKPQSFINIGTFFDAQQLAHELSRPRDLEWLVCGIYPHHMYRHKDTREIYQSLCSNPIELTHARTVFMKCLNNGETGWANKGQLQLVR